MSERYKTRADELRAKERAVSILTLVAILMLVAALLVLWADGAQAATCLEALRG